MPKFRVRMCQEVAQDFIVEAESVEEAEETAHRVVSSLVAPFNSADGGGPLKFYQTGNLEGTEDAHVLYDETKEERA